MERCLRHLFTSAPEITAISGCDGNSQSQSQKSRFLRVGFWQNGFLADFNVRAAGFCRGVVAGFFSHFCGQKCPEKSSRKIPDKILQILYNKNPRQFSAEGPGQDFGALSC